MLEASSSCPFRSPVICQGKELKAPEEKVVFEEDLSPEEKARILKEKSGPWPKGAFRSCSHEKLAAMSC